MEQDDRDSAVRDIPMVDLEWDSGGDIDLTKGLSSKEIMELRDPS